MCDSRVTIALLNIRCLLNKLPDITNDVNMNCADVVCLCETWLSPTQQIPQLFDGHVNLRCDRSHANNNKGGVLISVDHKLKPLGIYQLSNNSVECLVATISCSESKNIQLVLVYRSPSILFVNFANILEQILNNVMTPTNTPTIVMGDFNDPNMHGAVYNVMHGRGFTQLVQQPTTDQGSVLDHVYYNMNSNGIIVEVCDTYYSDHDTVLVSIPITGESESTSVMSVGESNTYITRSNNELVVNSSTSSSCKPDLFDSFTVPKISRGKRQMPNTNSDCSSNKRSNTNDDDDVEIIEELSRSFDCSHPNFRYYQVDEQWQRHWCSMLGLVCTKIYDRSSGSSDTPLTAPTARCVQHILGDGNCLFRSLSFVLTGSQQSHMNVRSLICEHMHKISRLMLSHISPCTSVQEYISDSRTNVSTVWGSNREIYTFANMCQVNVYVYDMHRRSWSVYSPNMASDVLNVD